MKTGQFSLELLVVRRVAGDVARSAGADAVLVHRVAILASTSPAVFGFLRQLTT